MYSWKRVELLEILPTKINSKKILISISILESHLRIAGKFKFAFNLNPIASAPHQ
jgi:hypothetical protein